MDSFLIHSLRALWVSKRIVSIGRLIDFYYSSGYCYVTSMC